MFAEFKKATRKVAEELFISFYKPHSRSDMKAHEKDVENIEELARTWATHVKDGEFSLAQLQGALSFE